MSILFIGKEGDLMSKMASDYVNDKFDNVTIVMSSKSKRIPDECLNWKGDYLFSYLSQWIIPQKMLDNVSNAALNWHPGSTNYPGIGCTNFAIYEDAEEFGITCHHMLSKVDTGSVVEEVLFPVKKDESVLTLTLKSYATIFSSFTGIIDRLSANQDLPSSSVQWKRAPFTRKQLNELCRLSLNMSQEEIKKRIRSTKYYRHWAYYEIDGRKYYLKDD